jgi:hypothetical protein
LSVSFIHNDPSRVNDDDDYEDCIHWLRTVHSRSKWAVVTVEKIYSELKRRKITPAEARQRIQSEGLDQGGAS